MSYKKTLGLALGSGGIKGFAHIGVIKALLENEIPIDYIAGTSIGAWVGAHYALFRDLSKLSEYTLGKKRQKFATFLEISLDGGLIGGNKMEKLLLEWFNDMSFEDTKIPLRILSTDLCTGRPVTFSSGKLAKAVRISMTIPPFFSPVRHDGMILVDGGLCRPVPDSTVREMHADIVLSVNLDGYVENIDPEKHNFGMTEVTARSFQIMRHHLAQYSMVNSDFVINLRIPQFGLSNWRKYFMSDYGSELVEIGAKETTKIIPALKAAMEI